MSAAAWRQREGGGYHVILCEASTDAVSSNLTFSKKPLFKTRTRDLHPTWFQCSDKVQDCLLVEQYFMNG